MPPKVKFTRDEIVSAALSVVRDKGIDAVTSREVASVLGVSTRPIFTYYDTMEQLKGDVYEMAKGLYREYLERGLEEALPFRGVGHQYLRFAKEQPELYKLLFLTKPSEANGGAMDALALSQDLVRESLMNTYHIDAYSADCYFRDLWLVAFSLGTLIVTGDCPYSDDQMSSILSEFSFSIGKAYKEIPGLPTGDFDRVALYEELTASE